MFDELTSCDAVIDRYSSLPSSQIKQLPVPALASTGCVVVTWVTNRAQHLRFVREELYPHWGVEVIAEWLWVKVQTHRFLSKQHCPIPRDRDVWSDVCVGDPDGWVCVSPGLPTQEALWSAGARQVSHRGRCQVTYVCVHLSFCSHVFMYCHSMTLCVSGLQRRMSFHVKDFCSASPQSFIPKNLHCQVHTPVK